MRRTRTASRTAKSSKKTSSEQTNRPGPPMTRQPSLYDRGIRQKAERQRKLQALETNLMKDCTFTPKTTNKTRCLTVTPPSSESVFDRLYRPKVRSTPSTFGSQRSTPRASNSLRRTAPTDVNHQTSPSSIVSSRIESSCYSSRIDDLYESGVRKMLSRPRSDEKEKQIRERRRDDQQWAECTFRPAIHGRKVQQQHQQQRKSSKLVMEPRPRRALPFEIVIAKDTGWDSPLRPPASAAVSPLRVEMGSSSAALTVQTDYGSI